jgi:hypothetical protein
MWKASGFGWLEVRVDERRLLNQMVHSHKKAQKAQKGISGFSFVPFVPFCGYGPFEIQK